MFVFAGGCVETAGGFEHLKVWPFKILHVIDKDKLLKWLDDLGLVPVLIGAERQVLSSTSSRYVSLFGKLLLIALTFWHEQDISPDFLWNIQQDFQVPVAQVRERLYYRCEVGEANLLSSFWAINSKDLINDVQEIGNSLISIFFGVGLGNQSHFEFLLLLFWICLQLGLVVAQLLECTISKDEQLTLQFPAWCTNHFLDWWKELKHWTDRAWSQLRKDRKTLRSGNWWCVVETFLGDFKVEIIHVGISPEVLVILKFIIFEQIVDDGNKLISVSGSNLSFDPSENSQMGVCWVLAEAVKN